MPKPKNQPLLDPKDLEPKANLYADATKPGYKHHMVVPMLQKSEDGKELHLPLVVLTPREQNEIEVQAYNMTRAQFKEVPKNDEPGMQTWNRLLDDYRAVLTIFYAARMPNDLSKKYFIGPDQISDSYTPEEVGILCNHYLTVRLTQPHLKHFDADDPNALQAVIDAIRKDGESDFFLNGFTTHSVNQLVKSLVHQLANLQRLNGSPGTP